MDSLSRPNSAIDRSDPQAGGRRGHQILPARRTAHPTLDPGRLLYFPASGYFPMPSARPEKADRTGPGGRASDRRTVSPGAEIEDPA